MYQWQVTHRSGFKNFTNFERAMDEYRRRTKGSNTASIRPVWIPQT